jgi:hypothetical protein
MLTQKNLTKTILILLMSIFIASATMAQDTLLINYQGHLTDGFSGEPITDIVNLEFSIYNTLSPLISPMWSETHPSVQVTNGLFSVLLGSEFGMSKSIFDGTDRWLGIIVNFDDEILPRTLFTAMVSAAVANRMVGDVTTVPSGIRIHSPDPCEPEPCGLAIDIASTSLHNSILINSPPPDDNRQAIKIEANNANLIEMYYPGVDTDEGVVQLGADETKGAFVEVHSAEPVTYTRVMMGGSTTDTGYVRLFGGDNDVEYKLLELTSHTNMGGNINFFDPANADRRGLLSIGSAPLADASTSKILTDAKNSTSGIGIYGFNPQPEPPGHIAFELTNEFLDNPGGRFAVYNTDDASVALSGGLMQIGHKDISYYPTGIFGVTATTSQLTLTGDASAGDPPVLTMVVGVDGARVGIGTNSPSDALYVIGDITATGAITELSSLKYKTNINQLDNALNLVGDLRGVEYNWRTNDYPEMKFSENQQIGLIAEEVESVIPELVHADANGDKSVNYSKLSAVLIEAVKELKEQNKQLRERVEKLENH